MGESECEHKYEYQGLVYEVGDWPMPGTGAHEVLYEHAYYCSRCLAMVYQPTGERHDSYQKIRHGATPKPKA